MCRFHVPGDSLVVMKVVVAAAVVAVVVAAAAVVVVVVVVVGLVVELVVVLVFLKTVPVPMLEVLLSLTTSTGRALSKGVTRECCDTHTHIHIQVVFRDHIVYFALCFRVLVILV